jgi:hypothetical protein
LSNSTNDGKKGKKLELKSLLNDLAIGVGCVKTIQINLGVIEVAALLASYAKIHDATKIPILFLYWDSPEEENRQLKTSLNA